MGSDTEAQAPSAEPAAPAKSGGGKGMIIAIVIIAVVAVVVIAFMFMGGGGEGLTGKWTVSGGEMEMKMVLNNDTANTAWINETIPADPLVIDFDDQTTMPEGMTYTDLGDGKFEITGFSMGSADFGTITGSYTIDGDTMTLEYSGSGTTIDDYSGDYMEIDMDVTVTFARV